jgi:hypothetical protein
LQCSALYISRRKKIDLRLNLSLSVEIMSWVVSGRTLHHDGVGGENMHRETAEENSAVIKLVSIRIHKVVRRH